MRIFIISDIHIDFAANSKWLRQISKDDYKNDVLLLAGDVCHDYDRLCSFLTELRKIFFRLFFTPGNHDLWVRNGEWRDSIHKFEVIMDFCKTEDIDVSARDIHCSDKILRIIPLHSWYTQPNEGDDALYWPKPGEDKENRMWNDNYYIRWPDKGKEFRAVDYFLDRNDLPHELDAPHQVITFSHFIPRKEMMFGKYPPNINMEQLRKYDRTPAFNFSKVAGSSLIDAKLRQYGSSIHVYGHQHINRDRIVDNVRYVSHCLGYPKERARGQIKGLEQGLKMIFDCESFVDKN